MSEPEIPINTRELEFDEMWHFIGSKKTKDGFTKQFLCPSRRLLEIGKRLPNFLQDHSLKNDAKYFSDNHDFIQVYAKDWMSANIALLPRTEKMNRVYKNPDDDPRGSWTSGDLVANQERTEGYYEVIGPTGKSFNVPTGKHWAFSEENLKTLMADNRIWFGAKGDAFPRLKRFLSEVQQGEKQIRYGNIQTLGIIKRPSGKSKLFYMTERNNLQRRNPIAC